MNGDGGLVHSPIRAKRGVPEATMVAMNCRWRLGVPGIETTKQQKRDLPGMSTGLQLRDSALVCCWNWLLPFLLA